MVSFISERCSILHSHALTHCPIRQHEDTIPPLLVIPRTADPRWRFDTSVPEDEASGTSNTGGNASSRGDAGPVGASPLPASAPPAPGSLVAGALTTSGFEERAALYRRAAEVTQVSRRIGRIGRAQSVLQIKSRTRMDRDAGAAGTSSKKMAHRISLASAAAAAAVFDMVGFRDLALAGTGSAATFHFLPQNIGGGDRSVADHESLGAMLFGLSASPLPPLSGPGFPSSSGPRPVPSDPSLESGQHGPHERRVCDSVSSLTVLAQFEKAGLIQGTFASSLAAVQETWSLAKVKVDAVGQEAMIKMFEKHPEWVKLFGFRDDANYRTCRIFKVNGLRDWWLTDDIKLRVSVG